MRFLGAMHEELISQPAPYVWGNPEALGFYYDAANRVVSLIFPRMNA